MNIEITGRQLEITDAIKEYIKKRVSKFPKMVGGLCDFHFVLTVEKHRHIAEVALNTRIGVFNANGESKDLYASIASVIEKLERQVKKAKQRKKDIARGNGKQKMMEQYEGAPIMDIGSPDDMAENPEVIEMKMNSKPMALDEALHELKNSGGSFIVFISSESEQINVLYRRNDGNYGLIHQ